MPDMSEVDLWTGMALMNPRNTQAKWDTALIDEQELALRLAIENDGLGRLPSPVTIKVQDKDPITGYMDTNCDRYRFRIWRRTQNPHSPAEGWREVFEIQIHKGAGFLQIDRIFVAPNRDTGLQNPFAN